MADAEWRLQRISRLEAAGSMPGREWLFVDGTNVTAGAVESLRAESPLFKPLGGKPFPFRNVGAKTIQRTLKAMPRNICDRLN